jgi:uncharacterized protein
MNSVLYPSWIEIPVHDLERALAFYRAVFRLGETPIYDDWQPMRVAVLLPSEKSLRNPGVSLVTSSSHTPCKGGTRVNFHVGNYAALNEAMSNVTAFGGTLDSEVIDEGDGVCYIIISDCEGNTLALSSYEEKTI